MRMVHSLLLLALLSVVTGCAVADTELTVVTYNVREAGLDDGELSWETRRSGVLKLLAESDADLIGLQELSPPQRRDLDDLGMECVECDSGFSNQNAILYDDSRLVLRESGIFWLSDTPDIPNSTSWGNETPRWVTWGHFEFRDAFSRPPLFAVYNVHLDHQAPESRLPGVESILQHAAAHAAELPIIVLGDFNSKPDWPAVRFLSRPDERYPHLPLKDLLSMEELSESKKTFLGFEEGSEDIRIDYIFVSQEFGYLDVGTITNDGGGDGPPSDHVPIRAVLTLEGAADEHR